MTREPVSASWSRLTCDSQRAGMHRLFAVRVVCTQRPAVARAAVSLTHYKSTP
jgi:hypothetical protein